MQKSKGHSGIQYGHKKRRKKWIHICLGVQRKPLDDVQETNDMGEEMGG